MTFGILDVTFLVIFICRRPYGIEKEFFVQLFLEPDESLKLPPTVGQLLNKMFKEQNISFSEVIRPFVSACKYIKKIIYMPWLFS